MSPTKTDAKARRTVRATLHPRALAHLNDPDRKGETGADAIASAMQMLEVTWDEGYELAESRVAELQTLCTHYREYSAGLERALVEIAKYVKDTDDRAGTMADTVLVAAEAALRLRTMPSVSVVSAEEFDRDPKAVYEASKVAPVSVLDSKGRPSMTVVTPIESQESFDARVEEIMARGRERLEKICSSEAFPCAHGPGWSCSKCVARPVEAPPVFKSARFEGINTRCDACGYSLGLHTVAIGRAGAGCPALGVAPRTNEARHEKATTEAADVGGDRSVAQEGSEGRGCARPSHPQRLPPDAAATTNADRVAPNAEHYKQLWDDSCQAVAELCAIAGAKAGDMPDLWTLKILIEDQKSDLERLAVQAKRVARAWEDDPTSTATENAIRELGIRTPCVDKAPPEDMVTRQVMRERVRKAREFERECTIEEIQRMLADERKAADKAHDVGMYRSAGILREKVIALSDKPRPETASPHAEVARKLVLWAIAYMVDASACACCTLGHEPTDEPAPHDEGCPFVGLEHGKDVAALKAWALPTGSKAHGQ